MREGSKRVAWALGEAEAGLASLAGLGAEAGLAGLAGHSRRKERNGQQAYGPRGKDAAEAKKWRNRLARST